MIDFEKANGFVIDLSTEQKTNEWLETVLGSKEDRQGWSLRDKRDLILDYYLYNYADDYIFIKAPNVYQIVEEDLEIKALTF